MNFQHHVLLIASQAPPEWFYELSGEYWKTFNPIVTQSAELLRNLPADDLLLLTVLVSPKEAEKLATEIRSIRDDKCTRYDFITIDDDLLLRDIFERRIRANMPSGDPEITSDESA